MAILLVSIVLTAIAMWCYAKLTLTGILLVVELEELVLVLVQ